MFKAYDVLQAAFIEQPLAKLWAFISPLYSIDESLWLKQLLPLVAPSQQENKIIITTTAELIKHVRADKDAIQLIDALLLEYSLNTKEGILLMCLAEALMRIPDVNTADALIRDKLSIADWKSHLNHSDSIFVNASTWGLMLTGKVVSLDIKDQQTPASAINRLMNKMSEPIIRQAMNQAMKIMGHQFVLGRTIKEAMKNSKNIRDKGFSYSFDMLGESALTASDAKKYFKSYYDAIQSVADSHLLQKDNNTARATNPTISIKLSALHPRYEVANESRVLAEMYDALLILIKHARSLNVAITIDAEEIDRLELSLKLFAKLYQSEHVKGWGGLGLVVQSYSKCALAVLVWLAALSKAQGDVIPLRLVKGAYWDNEIKVSQQNGYSNYPVYTRKEGTDCAYLACARFLLSDHIRGLIFPQFATHNAHTISAITAMTTHRQFEFQRLHGMGDALYNHAMALYKVNVRIYAPVGSHKDLLPYLVRRLLENGANSSFVHRLVDKGYPIARLTQHPLEILLACATLHNALIPLPADIFFAERKNSAGINIDIESQWQPFAKQRRVFLTKSWHAGPIINARTLITEGHPIMAPYDLNEPVGSLCYANNTQVNEAIHIAHEAFPAWSTTSVAERCEPLLVLADLLETHRAELVALCHREAGKTIRDSLDEVREAVDFCRFYSQQANKIFAESKTFTYFDGSQKQLTYQARGVFVCISPWNFPLAIFIGQIAAALASGNTVIAKPAEQTSLIAYQAITLMIEAGIPKQVIQFLPGTGKDVGAILTSDLRIKGVVFTGSTETAQRINRSLAARDCEPVPLIAETGGQNAMIVDSTALPEQVVRDVIRSAFASAGQRCSALRVLFVQQDIADRVISLIQGSMAELSVGLPQLHSTDVGPVIDLQAQTKLMAHIESLKNEAILIAQVSLNKACQKGYFVAPSAFEISDIKYLKKEHFGPVLHIIRFTGRDINNVIDQINNTGFGLTLGIHSRNERTSLQIAQQARVGNCYINRDQVGAVVGVQPFGGQGLSGTGPKAGGPRYLYRFTQAVITA